MLSLIYWFLHRLSWWPVLDAKPLDCLLQGVIGACGISVLRDITRVHLFLEEQRHDATAGQRRPLRHDSRARSGLVRTLQSGVLVVLLSLVGSRVASLVVLEFSLRAISAWVTDGLESRECQLVLVQCHFSLGCALSCSLHFLHEGAPQRWLSLMLLAALGWVLSNQTSRLLHHVEALYTLHSSRSYCGVCMTLLSTGGTLLPMLLRKTLITTFSVAVLASISIVNRHFISATEALKFWTPLTICYTLLVVYMQDERHRAHAGQPQQLLKTVAVRLGGLLVLMLTVGRWADVVHILICFLGEAVCLIAAQDLLAATTPFLDQEDFEDYNEEETQQKETKDTDTITK
ncbi:unnamed protein product [Lota lota]